MYFILTGKSFNKLDVVAFITVLGENDILSFKLVILVFDSLADFMKTLSQQHIGVGCLDDTLQSLFEVNGLSLGHWWKNILIN